MNSFNSTTSNSPATEQPEIEHLQVGPYVVDRRLNQISSQQQTTTLEPKAIELLFFLAQWPNLVKSRQEIHRGVWGNIQVTDHAINRLISQLRKAMMDTAAPYQIIETVPKRGYRLIAPVKPLNHKAEQRIESDQVVQPVKRFNYLPFILFVVTTIFALSLFFNKSTLSTFEPAAAVEAITAMPAREWHPRYTPNDGWISYLHHDIQSNFYQLYLQQNKSAQPKAIFSTQSSISAYAWLGNSKQLVLASFANGQCNLNLYDLNQQTWHLDKVKSLHDCGSAPVRQLTYSEFSSNLYWTQHNNSGLSSASDVKMLSLNSNNSANNPRAIPQLNGIYGLKASPDGRWLVLLKQFQWEQSEVYLYDIDKQQQTLLHASDRFIFSISWAREGKELLYISNNQFRQLSLDGTTKALGFSSENQAREVQFSATSERFLYVSDNARYQLQSFSLDQTLEATPVTWRSAQNERNPIYANDKTTLAFISNRSGKYQIWIREKSGELYPLSTGDLDLYQTLVRFSADDKYLLFHSDNALYRYDLSNKQYKKLTTDTMYADVVGWSYRYPKQLYLRSNHDGQFNIWRMDSDTQLMVKVTKNGGFSGNESADGKFFYYTKDKQNGLWRIDLDSGEEILFEAGFHLENYLSWQLLEDGIYYLHGEQGPGLYWWEFASNTHQQLWQMPAFHHGGFAVSKTLNSVIFGLKPLGQWDIMQLKGL